jgi:electron transfer flavoprotein beta subunit
MNIAVCAKWVIGSENAIKVENGAIKDRGIYHVVNPYDLIAVEEAIRLRDLQDSGEVIVVSMGSPGAEKGLRKCLALGADRGILLCDAAFEGSDSYTTALVLSKAIASLEYDLVLCGDRAVDTEAGQVGSMIAEILGIPVISKVVKIEASAGGKEVTVYRKLEKGNREIVEVNLPVLLTVETGLNKPKYPNLRAIFAAQSKEVKEYDLKALGLSEEEIGSEKVRTRVTALATPKPRPKKMFTPDSQLSAEERLRLLMSGGVTQKQGDMLEGDLDNMASNVVKFLNENKLLPE